MSETLGIDVTYDEGSYNGDTILGGWHLPDGMGADTPTYYWTKYFGGLSAELAGATRSVLAYITSAYQVRGGGVTAQSVYIYQRLSGGYTLRGSTTHSATDTRYRISFEDSGGGAAPYTGLVSIYAGDTLVLSATIDPSYIASPTTLHLQLTRRGETWNHTALVLDGQGVWSGSTVNQAPGTTGQGHPFGVADLIFSGAYVPASPPARPSEGLSHRRFYAGTFIGSSEGANSSFGDGAMIKLYTLALTVPAVLAGNLARLANGAEAVVRDGKLWWRRGPAQAWQQGPSVTKHGLLLPSATGPLAVVDSSVKRSTTLGATVASGRPTDLPAALDTWPATTGTLCDAVYDRASRLLLGVGTKPSGTSTVIYAVHRGVSGASPVETTVDTLTSAQTDGVAVRPFCWRDRQGRWRVGCFGVTSYREWVATTPAATAWGAATVQTLAATARMTGVAAYTAVSGQQAAVGHYAPDSKVYAWHRPGVGATWQGPVTVASAIATAVVPYLTRWPSGRWEAGWRAASAWVKRLADTPAGTWSAP